MQTLVCTLIYFHHILSWRKNTYVYMNMFIWSLSRTHTKTNNKRLYVHKYSYIESNFLTGTHRLDIPHDRIHDPPQYHQHHHYLHRHHSSSDSSSRSNILWLTNNCLYPVFQLMKNLCFIIIVIWFNDLSIHNALDVPLIIYLFINHSLSFKQYKLKRYNLIGFSIYSVNNFVFTSKLMNSNISQPRWWAPQNFLAIRHQHTLHQFICAMQ